MSLITLTTDFGASSPYVAVMKGVILSIHRDASLQDLSHQIPPQNLPHASYFLATAIPFFPPGSIHVVVVDPGVGTDRNILLASVKDQLVLAPDNGVLTGLFDHHPPAFVFKLTESRYWRTRLSHTFHGRDIFAPVAAHLGIDSDPTHFGIPVSEWARLPGERWRADKKSVFGSVQFVDNFGNLISNIPGEQIAAPPKAIQVAGREIAGLRWVKTYGEAAEGDLVALISSDGFLEIARVNGDAARHLGVQAGAALQTVFA